MKTNLGINTTFMSVNARVIKKAEWERMQQEKKSKEEKGNGLSDNNRQRDSK